MIFVGCLYFINSLKSHITLPQDGAAAETLKEAVTVKCQDPWGGRFGPRLPDVN